MLTDIYADNTYQLRLECIYFPTEDTQSSFLRHSKSGSIKKEAFRLSCSCFSRSPNYDYVDSFFYLSISRLQFFKMMSSQNSTYTGFI